MINPFRRSPSTRNKRIAGQAMVEYTVILAFGVLVLLGPGGDVIAELEEVLRQNYRGYSYAMSLSTMPDFDTGQDLRDYIDDLALDPELDDATIDQLAVDPVQGAITTALEPLSNAASNFNSIKDILGDMDNLDDLAAEMAADAISPF